MVHLRNGSHGFHAVGLILLVFVVTIIGVTGYAVFAVNSGEDPKFSASNPAPSPQSAAPETAADLIAAAKKSLADNITINEVAASSDPANPKPVAEPADAGTANVATGKDAAYFKAAESDYYVEAEQGASLTVMLHGDTAGKADGKIVARVTAGLTDALTKAGLKQVQGAAYTNQWTATYKNDDIVCQTSAKESDTNPRSLRCSNLIDINATALKTKPIVEAYRAAHPEDKSALLLTAVDIKDGRTPNYKLAYIGLGVAGEMGGAAGMFYQQTDGAWQFFSRSQMTPTCASFEASPGAKAAFKGERCLNDGQPGEHTVQ